MTAQLPEILILDGEQVQLFSTPGLPEGEPRLVRILDQAQASASLPMAFSTACWRNYRATWEIKDGRLYLNAVAGIFRLEGESPLFAGWYSGVLRVPRGERVQYVHMGFESKFERDLLIQIEAGRMVRTWEVDNKNFGS